MKTLHALSLVGLLSCGAAAGLGFTGCSSSSDPAPGDTTDTGTSDDTFVAPDTNPADTAPRDTAPKPPTDSTPLVCDKLPLDSTFACAAPTAAQKGGPPSSACTEAMLQEYATKCIAADFKVGSACADFRSAFPDCNTCIGNWALDASVLAGKIYPDRDKCWYKVLDDSCSTSVNCMFNCDTAVCGDCDTSAGSSADGTTTEQQDCVNRERKKGGTAVAKGACYDIATGAALKCLNDNADKVEPCFVTELFSPSGTGGHPDLPSLQQESVAFMRGACRDNGDWSKSAFTCSTPPCDAGPSDTGSDAGSDTTTTADVAADSTDGG